MSDGKAPPKALAWIFILRWTIALIFFANAMPKFSDPHFGAAAQEYFATFRDDILMASKNPYTKIFTTVIVPNAYIFAWLVKHLELFIAGVFFIGFPMRLATWSAFMLHMNYIMIASMPSLLYLNLIMMVAEFTCLAASKDG